MAKRRRAVDRVLEAVGATDLVRYRDERITANQYAEWSKREEVVPLVDLEAYLFAEEARPIIATLLDAGDGGVIREDLVDYFIAYITRTKTQRELYKEFVPYLERDQIQCLQVAMAAENLRNLGRDQDSQNLVKKAERRFGELARKMNNLYASNYLQRFFLFWLKMFQVECSGDVKNTKHVFQRWFSNQLEFFERGIFVNQEFTKGRITEELSIRLLADHNPTTTASVWAAGVELINFAHAATKDWVEANPSFEMVCELGKYGAAIAVKIMVFNIERNPEIRPKRLAAYWWKEF